MGYTHYWKQTRDLAASEWAGIQHAADAIVERASAEGIRTAAIIDDTDLTLNGVDDDAHDDFVLGMYTPDELDFCKTARKPYDTVVTALLCYIATLDGAYIIDSDGTSEDFAAGLGLAKRALPFLAGALAVPALGDDS